MSSIGRLVSPDQSNKLLVIDDQPDLCEFISEAAAGLGFESKGVTDPDAFRRAVQEFQPTVVVLDLQMPGADGIELLRYLGERGSKAQILVAGDNFGCGSSREHAPWALLDFGIRCVIAPSFADIFYNNCFKNGILPIVVTPEQLALLQDDAERGSNATLTVDLEAQTIQGPDGGTVHFDIDPARKQILLEGLDDIAGTLKSDPSITSFENKMAADCPWL